MNNTGASATFDCGITQDVTVSADTTWSGNLGAPTPISNLINFVVPGTAGVNGENSLSYSSTIGVESSANETITLGSDSGCSVTLAPGESAESSLQATKGQMTVQASYQQTLAGFTALNYGIAYMDHHFWGLDIQHVMQAANLPVVLSAVGTTEVNFYTASQVVVSGGTTTQRVTFPAKRTALKLTAKQPASAKQRVAPKRRTAPVPGIKRLK